MRELTASEGQFAAMTQQIFGFLLRSHCAREVHADIEGVLIRFTCKSVAVELRFESDQALFVDVVPLVDGRLPRHFDESGREPPTRFSLAGLIARIDPTWRPPEHLDELSQRDDLLDALHRLAEGLERNAERILAVDTVLFGSTEDQVRRDLVQTLLENWARFVDQVRRGYTGNIGDYTLAITGRGQLQDVLDVWHGDRGGDPRTQLARLDRAFEDLTEAVPSPRRGDSFSLTPDPKALRWWRRPKVLTGELAEHFGRRA